MISPQRTRRRRPGLVAGLAGGLALLAAIGAAGRVAEQHIRAAVREQVPSWVRIGAIGFRWPVGVELRDVAVVELPGGDLGALLVVPRLRLSVQPASLFRQPVVVDQVELVRPRLTIIREPNGDLRVPSVLVGQPGASPPVVAAGSPVPPAPRAARAGLPSLTLDVARGRVREGVLEVVDRQVRPDGFVSRLVGVSATVVRQGRQEPPVRYQVTARAVVAAGIEGRRAGTVRFAGRIAPQVGVLEGTVALERCELAPFSPYLQRWVPMGVTQGTLGLRCALHAEGGTVEVFPEMELRDVAFGTSADDRIVVDVSDHKGGIALKLPASTIERYLRQQGGVVRVSLPPLRARLDGSDLEDTVGRVLAESALREVLLLAGQQWLGTSGLR